MLEDGVCVCVCGLTNKLQQLASVKQCQNFLVLGPKNVPECKMFHWKVWMRKKAKGESDDGILKEQMYEIYRHFDGGNYSLDARQSICLAKPSDISECVAA